MVARKAVAAWSLSRTADYPDGVKNNAKRGIELNEKNGNKCATGVGKVRAQQLAQGKPVERRDHLSDVLLPIKSRRPTTMRTTPQACGTISFLLWGGLAGKRWAESKLKELGKL
jgi:hypothetical protein